VPAGSPRTQQSDDPPASTAFKDRIDAALVDRLASAYRGVEPAFDPDRFTELALDGLEELELKARTSLVAAALHATLPEDFEEGAAATHRLLDKVEEGAVSVEGWELWPVTEWVALAGRGHASTALELLGRLTRYATGEFAIRPFLDDDPAAVLAVLHDWAGGEDEHRRRLASEGTRPRLPWAPRLAVAADEPGFAVPLLDRLVTDPSEYVRRSVSNHLNDLTRCDLDLGLQVAERWLRQAEEGTEQERAHTEWVVRRGLRSLVKAGDPTALRLLGHDPDVAVHAKDFEVLTPSVVMPGEVEWRLELESAEPDTHRIVVDYVIHFVGAGGRTGRKVFKWTTFDLGPGERRSLQRRHAIRPITTRTYRSGRHRIEVQVNGSVVAEGAFELDVPASG